MQHTSFTKLNERQREAVKTTKGAVLVLAGAGSGKTRVLTERVSYILESNLAKPWEILCITFTNKAAAEMRERIENALGTEYDSRDMWISTFHSMCARILRRYGDRLGYTRNFLIYDTLDTERIVKSILQDLNINTNKVYGEKYIKQLISSYKNGDTDLPFGVYAADENPLIAEYAQEIYDRYQETMSMQNAMDFDDLLLLTLKLLENDGEALNYYQSKFKYILVDEYQDTNVVQYKLIKMLSGVYGNIFAVGDDDQSIYGFRGATIRNILEFEKDFSGAVIIRLEQNYRSDSRILNIANEIIRNNKGRKGKELWSEINDGLKPGAYTAINEQDEATKIAQDIQQTVGNKNDSSGLNVDYKNIAILYRTHTLAHLLEDKLRIFSIPYKVYGGMSFYERREIKDILAYLNIIVNPIADAQLLRIINMPKRGIGASKITALRTLAESYNLPIMSIIEQADDLIADKVLRKKMKEFYELISKLKDNYQNMRVPDIISNVYELTGYKKMLEEEATTEAKMRMENVEEMINSAYTPLEIIAGVELDVGDEETPLENYLQNISLLTDMDNEDSDNSVTLMTVHAAKGLEFDVVYIAGMEEGLFPNKRSIDEDLVEEERRLCYVAVTRAKKKLYMLHAQNRMIYGKNEPCRRSRFLEEAGEDAVEDFTPVKIVENKTEKKKAYFTGYKSDEIKPHKVSSDFCEGAKVTHKSFGTGVILNVIGEGDTRVAVVDFEAVGQKKMFLAFAPLDLIE